MEINIFQTHLIAMPKKAKNAQEAHEAIRPTNIKRKPNDIKKYVNAISIQAL